MVTSHGILVMVTALLLLPSARPLEYSYCDPSNNFTPNSTSQATLNLLAAALPANVSSSPAGFATLSAGTESRAYAMALCCGDANASSCAACVARAFRAVGEGACANNTDVTMYEDDCVLRFANRQFLDFLKAQQWQVGELRSVPAVAVALFSAAATAILTAVSAASSNSTAGAANGKKQYFATGEVDFDPRIYALAQCVPALTPAQCSGCLGQLLGLTKIQLSTKPVWVTSRVEWCDLRYNVRPFYQGQAMLQLQPQPETGAAKKKISSAAGISVGVVCSLVLLLMLSVLASVRIRFRRRINKATEHDNPFKKISRAQCVIFDLPALQEATEKFSQRNKLGEGGFGAVYKVWHHWKNGTMSHMMDQSFEEHTQNQQLRCVHVGLMCVQADPVDRPEISTVIFMLTRDNMELQPPGEPAFYFGSFRHRSNLHSSSGASANSDFVAGEGI